MHPFMKLEKYPDVTLPDPQLKAAINQVIDAAITEINAFLDQNSGGAPYLDAVFGTSQVKTVTANYRSMLDVLAKWRDSDKLVKLSGWQIRFGRAAATNATTTVITLPAFAAVPAGLQRTLIHESVHGVSGAIVDDAYVDAAVAFQSIPGVARPFNAPYYDYAIAAWRAGDMAATRKAVGTPNVSTGKKDSPVPPSPQTQFQRAQSIVTHARIHAENMLHALTDDARDGKLDNLSAADGLPIPFFQRQERNKLLNEADIDAVSAFVDTVTDLHKKVSALTYSREVAAPSSYKIDGNKFVFVSRETAAVTPKKIKGDVAADPLVKLMVDLILERFKPGLTIESLGKIDLQYHRVRGTDGHE